MTSNQIRKIFLIILKCYSGFGDDETKVAIWTDILKNTEFESAQCRLREYIANPENKFPPHPGALMESKQEGRYIPNAAETKQLLEERNRQRERFLSAPSYDTKKARLRLVHGNSSGATRVH